MFVDTFRFVWLVFFWLDRFFIRAGEAGFCG